MHSKPSKAHEREPQQGYKDREQERKTRVWRIQVPILYHFGYGYSRAQETYAN